MSFVANRLPGRAREAIDAVVDSFRLLVEVDRRLTFVSLGLSLLEGLLYPVLLLLFAALLEGFFEKDGGRLARDLPLLAAFLLVLAAQQVVGIATETVVALLRARSVQLLNERLVAKLATVPYRLFEDNEFQATYGLAIREASYRPGFIVEALVRLVTALIAFVAIIATLVAAAPLFAGLFFVVIVLAAVEVRFHTRTVELQTSAAPDLMRLQFLSAMSVDPLWQRDLRTYRSDVIVHEFRRLGGAYVRRLASLLAGFQKVRSAVGIASAAVIVGSVAAMIALADSAAIDPPVVALVLPALFVGLAQARGIAYSSGMLAETLAYASRLFAFLGMSFGSEVTVGDPAGVGAVVDAVVLERVRVRFPGGDRDALTGVDHEFSTGVTAVVGPNAAGKTTLVKLLSGLLAPTEGAVYCRLSGGGRVPIGAVQRAVLFQDPAHLHLTVRENVTMRVDTRTPDDSSVHAALRTAGLAELIERLPLGIDTVVGAGFGGATDLSGGEWQRLALARLIYHDSPIILLDEPIASLDVNGERQIFELVAELGSSRIVVFTTHRYSTIQNTDRIVVLVDGRVAEVGTHRELLELGKEYRALYMSQATRRRL